MPITSAIGLKLLSHLASFCSLDPEKLSRQTLIQDIGLDSLALPQILEALQTEFSIDLRDDDVAAILDARSIDDYLQVLEHAHSRAAKR